MVQMHKILPSPPLTGIVKFFYTLSNHSSQASGILVNHPQGSIDMLFMLKGQLLFGKQQSHAIEAKKMVIIGQQSSYFQCNFEQQAQIIGIAFQPTAFSQLSLFSPADFTDHCSGEVETEYSFLRSLYGYLLEQNSLQTQLELLETTLIEHLHKHQPQTPIAWDLLLKHMHHFQGQTPIKTLAKKANMSERNFRRHFKNTIGISPKKYATIIRFNAALAQLSSLQSNNSLAIDYYDQNHLIKEFKKFTNYTPQQYFKINPLLPNLFK